MPTFTPVDFDPFAEGGGKGPKFTPVDFDPFKEPAGRGTNYMAGFEDVLSGDQQTPGVAGKLLGPATIGEEGEVYIKGPQGELTPTDDTKHIKVGDKIYERSALEKYQLPGGDAASALAAGLQSFSPLRAATGARMTNVAARGPAGTPPPGTARFYHGGQPETLEGGGGRWLTPDEQYARGYAGDTGKVYYTDIPENSPLLRKSYDDTGTSQKAPYAAFEAPEDVARTLRELSAAPEQAMTPERELAAALQRGEMMMPRAVGGNRLYQQVGGGLESAPLIGAELKLAKQASLESAQAARNKVVGELGSGTAEEAGLTARRGLRDFIERGKTAESAPNYAGIEDRIDPTVVSPLPQTRDLYTQLMAEHAATKQAGTPKYLDMLEGAIAPDSRTAALREQGYSEKAIEQIMSQIGPSPDAGGLTIPGARELRSQVLGELRKAIPGTTEHNRLKSMSGALGGDIEGMLRAQGGPEVISQLEQANRIHRELSDNARRLAKITGVKEDSTPATIFNRIAGMAKSKAREDIQGLEQVKHVLGDEMNEVTSAMVARMGRDNKGNFSASNFLRDYEEITPRAKSALFSPAHREALDDIKIYSKKFVEAEQYRNFSGTTRTSLLYAPLVALGSLDWSGLSAMAGYALGTKYLAGPLDVNKILSKPASAAAAAKWTKAYTTYSQYNTAASAAALRLASRNLLNNIKEDKSEK